MKRHCVPLLAVLLLLCACNNNQPKEDKDDSGNTAAVPMPAALDYTVVNTYPHDTSSYTEGLFFHNNLLYEGTGLEQQSKLRRVQLETGKAVQEVALPKDEFGEGIVLFNNSIYQLTWKNYKVHVYDASTFKKTSELHWSLEGWGMTQDGKHLIVSTGSNNLYYVEPATFKIQKIVSVTDNYGMVNSINELEWVNGFIYANRYETNYILKIDPETGRVVGRADLTAIFQKSGKTAEAALVGDPNDNVLNGIAYNSARNSFYVTGKRWPLVFEIKFN